MTIAGTITRESVLRERPLWRDADQLVRPPLLTHQACTRLSETRTCSISLGLQRLDVYGFAVASAHAVLHPRTPHRHCNVGTHRVLTPRPHPAPRPLQADKDGPRKTVYFPGGERYRGAWRANLRHGKGCLTYRNGAKYEGDWHEGLRHGQGTLWTFSGGKYKVKYSGGWHADVPTGAGTYYDPEGNLYEGEWREGRRCGHGRMAYGAAACGGAGGATYDGEWRDDARHGRGTMTYANGNVFEGHWEGDVRCGPGTLFLIDKGKRFDGVWACDVQRAGTYRALEAPPAGAPGALPVLELADAAGVLQGARAAAQ